jgi:nitrile hydratase
LDPRGVLADFGVALPADKEIRVWDSTAEIRYLVLPERPAGSEGLSEEQLAGLVTRDSMIGTGLAKSPDGGGIGPVPSDAGVSRNRGGEGSDPVAP